MANLFISYSRVDIAFVEQLYRRLQGMRPQATIWYDQAPHGLLGGDNWWDQIMQAIADCDVFIYVLSNESVQSKYCQAEFEEARRLQKRIITIQARDRTKMTDDLRDIQYVDMKNGVDDPDALVRLTAALDRQLGLARKRRALWKPQTPKPGDDNVPERPASAPEVDTPTLQRPEVEQEKPVDERPWWGNPTFIIGAVLVPLLAAVIGGYMQNPNFFQSVFGGGTQIAANPTNTSTVGTAPALSETQGNGNTADEASLVPTDGVTEEAGTAERAVSTRPLPSETATNTEAPTITPSPTEEPTPTQTDTPQPTPTPTEEPTVDIVGVVATLDAQGTAQVRATNIAATTQAVINATATATQWTDTPTATHTFTPDVTASIAAFITERAAATETQLAVDATATATLWTATPTATSTPTPTLSPEQIASTPVASNDDWTPVERDFNGVTMVLVPAGCFMMGSNDGDDDEQPVHEQCFDAPFWIDKYEVTNAQYGGASTGTTICSNRSSEPDQPRNCVNWFDAVEHCESRGARLPTEREWEYAARGPDALMYPWGNMYDASRLVGVDNATYGGRRTAPVGTRPNGESWVDALDMSGNVSEWTSTLYRNYPYVDENENTEDTSTSRVWRGGGFFFTDDDWRTANRNRNLPGLENLSLGFRCVRPAG